MQDRGHRACRRWDRRAVLLAAALALAGCEAGPNFVRPAAPQVKDYTAGAMPAALTPGGGEPAQHLATGQELPGRWWALYRSPQLDAVLKQAIADSPTLAAARATLAQAQQAVRQASGAFYPQIDAAAGVQRQHQGGTRETGGFGSSSSTVDLYSVGPTVSYVPDVFGGTRRRVEQEQALAQNQRYQLAAAYLSLTGNAVTQAIAIASARLQISAVRDILADDRRNLELVQLKYRGGKASRLDVLTAESQLANDRTQLPPLQQQLSTARHALAVLVGRYPGQWSAPAFSLKEFTLPARLPLSVPSALVHQRPDILAAEAQLHAASAAIGVAAAQLYPSITLSGSLAAESLSAAALFQGPSLVWSLAANLSAPIFHGYALRAQKQAAVDAFRASAYTYQNTVLTAFGQVADVLRALDDDAELVSAQKHALDTSATTLRLQRLSYAEGKSDLLQLLDAERAYQQARLGYSRAEGQRYQDTAQLFVAMGGGWWKTPQLAAVQGAGAPP